MERSDSLSYCNSTYCDLPSKLDFEKLTAFSGEDVVLNADSPSVAYENARRGETKKKEREFDRQTSSTQKLRRNRFGGARKIKRKRHATVYSRQTSRVDKLNRQPSISTKLSGCHLYEEVKNITVNNGIYQELVAENKVSALNTEAESPIYWNFVVDEFVSSTSNYSQTGNKCPTLPPARRQSGNYTKLATIENNNNTGHYEEVHIYEELDATFATN